MKRDVFLDRFGGIYVPLVNPYDTLDSFNTPYPLDPMGILVPSLNAVVNQVIGLGDSLDETCLPLVDGILVNGETGEFRNMDRDLRKHNLALVVEYVASRVPVVANVTDNWRLGSSYWVFNRTKMNIDDAVGVGADAVLVCPLYYEGITNASAGELLLRLADYSPLPLVIYNNPGIHNNKLGYNISPRLVAHLSKHPYIVGIKDSSGDIKYFRRLMGKVDSEGGDYFKIFQGSEKRVFDSFSGDRKPDGIVPSMSNIAPEFVRAFYDAMVDPSVDLNDKFNLQMSMDLAGRLVYGTDYSHITAGIKDVLFKRGVISDREMIDGSHLDIGRLNRFRFNLLTSKNQGTVAKTILRLFDCFKVA